MSLNPYERRRDAAQRRAQDEMPDQIMAANFSGPQFAGPRESPLRLDDLEAIAYRHHRRGWTEGRESRDADVAAGRREAWDEGFATGLPSGEAQILERIDELVGARVRETRDHLLSVSRRIAANEIDSAQARELELLAAVVNAGRLLGHLIDLHHQAFVGELPF